MPTISLGKSTARSPQKFRHSYSNDGGHQIEVINGVQTGGKKQSRVSREFRYEVNITRVKSRHVRIETVESGFGRSENAIIETKTNFVKQRATTT